jgi:mRNA interferase MazF
MKRGDLYRVYKPKGDPKAYRVFAVISTVVCAPVFTSGHELSTQVAIGVDEGLKHLSWIMCDNLVSLRKSDLTHYVGSVSGAKAVQLSRALKMALDLS